MEEKKVYSVADLAEKVGVPRTTITDWLNRFSQYMESEMRGKRKVFTDAALNVLSEIAKLRDLGHSTYDIERELAKSHPVQAELHQESAVEPGTDDAEAPVEGSENALVAPVARIQAEEFSKMLNNELARLTQSLEQNQIEAKKLAKSTLRWQIGAIALLAFMAVAAIVAAIWFNNHISTQRAEINSGNQQINDLKLSTSVLVDELKERKTQIQEQGQKLDNMVVVLDKSRQDYQENVDKLRKELGEQQTKFEEELKKQSESATEKYQAELTRMREEFTKQQLEFLQNQEKKSKSEAELKAAAEQLEQKDRELKEREQKLEELKKSLAAEAEARAKQAALQTMETAKK